jgi:hypothetical protein
LQKGAFTKDYGLKIGGKFFNANAFPGYEGKKEIANLIKQHQDQGLWACPVSLFYRIFYI